MTVLLREAIGDRLRHARTNQQRTLREISHSARVSLGYLSEVERGQKEASSELLAAICEALELPLSELMYNVAGDVAALESVSLDRELTRPKGSDQPAGTASERPAEITDSVGGMPQLCTTIGSPSMRVFAA